MDIKEYINSGILENYVFDSASKQERQEVECMSHIYPEIKTALTELQETIERVAIKSALQPPNELKGRVMLAVRNTPQEEPERKEETKIVTLEKKSNASSKFLAAASIVLLIGLGAYTYFLQADLSATEENLVASNEQKEKVNEAFEGLQAKNKDILEEMAFVKNENTKKIIMAGTPNHAEKLATVYWNTEESRVLLDAKQLPEPPENKDYQLWVLVDGTPQDMGVFNPGEDDNLALREMKPVTAGQAFAITIEPKGGSETPSLDQLMVIGNV